MTHYEKTYHDFSFYLESLAISAMTTFFLVTYMTFFMYFVSGHGLILVYKPLRYEFVEIQVVFWSIGIHPFVSTN